MSKITILFFSSEKSLNMSLKNIDFFRYLPYENAKFYYLPMVYTQSIKSFLFHSKMISNIVRSYIFKTNKSYNLKPGDLVSKQINIDEEKKKEMISDVVYADLPDININLSNNLLSVWMDLSIEKLNKRGYKQNTKSDSLKEDLACAIGVLSGVNKFSKIVWDPFCGCGTLIIESIIHKSEKFQRNMSKFKYFKDMKFITENKEAMEFLKKNLSLKIDNDISSKESNLLSKLKLDSNQSLIENSIYDYCNFQSDIKYYASDIMPMSFEYSLNNFKNSKIYNSNKENLTDINPMILKENINQFTTLLLGDYEKIFKIIRNDTSNNKEKNSINVTQKITILTHLPYKVENNISKTVKLYKEFSSFLKKNFDAFDSVNILIKKRDKKDNLNFEVISELQWDTIGEFNNEGIETKLIRLKI